MSQYKTLEFTVDGDLIGRSSDKPSSGYFRPMSQENCFMSADGDCYEHRGNGRPARKISYSEACRIQDQWI